MSYASSLMLYSDEAIHILGGFTGENPVFTQEDIQIMVENGELRYFLVSTLLLRKENRDIYKWI